MKLSAIFCDGMILQRECENRIYGEEMNEIGHQVTVDFRDKMYQSVIGEDGHFVVTIPAMKAGGPYSMTIRCDNGDEETFQKVIQDIWIGDVYLLSGQSNMELPIRRTLDVSADEVAATRLPLVRQFLVPMDFRSFDEQQEYFDVGEWTPADENHIMNFSAAGLFFAKDMFEKEKVAIGLVMTAVGGSTVEAWLDRETLRQYGNYEDKIRDFMDIDQFHKFLEGQEEAAQKWRAQIADKDFIAEDKVPEGLTEMTIPCMVAELGWKDFHGSLIFYREFELADFDDEKAYIYLGAIIESDEVWINGKKVGETCYRYPPRKYPIPSGILRKGKNIVTVRMEIEGINGGFVRGMPYHLFDGRKKIDLSGTWYYRVGHTIAEPKPVVLFPPLLPVGLFNSSLAPLKNTAFRAVLWYQGESSDQAPDQHLILFRALVKKWREYFGVTIPFFMVQISGFRDPVYDNEYMERRDSGWGRIRDEQRQCLSIEDVYVVPSMDVGEYCDLHPQNKKAVGVRLANAVKKELFGEETHYEMPVPDKVTCTETEWKITFLHMNQRTKKEIRGFQFVPLHEKIIVEKKDRMDAKAYLEKDTVTVMVPKELQGQKELRIVYDWEDYPEYYDLVNEYGVIAGSFAIDVK